jgi:hypothetical protein
VWRGQEPSIKERAGARMHRSSGARPQRSHRCLTAYRRANIMLLARRQPCGSLPPWELVCNGLIVEPFDVTRQIPRVPF